MSFRLISLSTVSQGGIWGAPDQEGGLCLGCSDTTSVQRRVIEDIPSMYKAQLVLTTTNLFGDEYVRQYVEAETSAISVTIMEASIGHEPSTYSILKLANTSKVNALILYGDYNQTSPSVFNI